MKDKKVHETDVLVIGGGMAGCFAAIKARENHSQVLLVDKGYVSSSGQTPFANSYTIFNEEWGHDFDACMEQINRGGDYINNRAWTEIVLRECYDRYKDLESYGVKFVKDDDKLRIKTLKELGPCEAIFPYENSIPINLRKKVLQVGAKILDRVMITDLIKKDNRVIGAVGITVSEGEFCVFKAKSVIICTGAAGFKPVGWPISNLTADGDMMAYRAGAEITGKEFIDTHGSDREAPAYVGAAFLKRPPGGAPPPPIFTNAYGETFKNPSIFHLGAEFQAHAGKAPIYGDTPMGKIELVSGASAGMSTHKAEGIWPVGTNGFTGVEGLFAAGDSLGVMLSGGAYSAIGIALAGSAVIGARAGYAASEAAKQVDLQEAEEQELEALQEGIYAPLERKGGFSPRWITQLMQNVMFPYFTMMIKEENRLKTALSQIEYYKESLLPKIYAKDAHELRQAIEVKNMLGNAEMKLKASLFRQESRGTHYREDYPQRDDENWFAWIKIKEDSGEMVLTKEMIPEDWKKPTDEKYLFDFPKFHEEA